MKMLVFGPGWLGCRIASYFGATISKNDILDTNAVIREVDDFSPDVVVNAAGKCGRPNIDWCEATPENRALTMHVNAYGPVILQRGVNAVAAYRKREIKFVHLSSGCLWEWGTDVSEEETPTPPSLYSESKALGEAGMKKTALILRLRMPVSDDVNPRNLISKLNRYKYVLNEPNSVTVVDDLLVALEKMLLANLTGVYNVTNPRAITGAQIMGWYKELVDPNHEFTTVTMKELKSIGLVKAGRSNVTLSCAKLASHGIELPPARERVRECLVQYKRNLDAQTTAPKTQ